MKNDIGWILLLALGFMACSKGDSTTNQLSATISGNQVDRSTSNTNLRFTVSLSAAATAPISIGYRTADATAVAGTDYTATTGTLQFAAGEQSKTIDVVVIGDSLRKANGYFLLQLNSATGVTLQNAEAAGNIINENGTYFPVADAGYQTPTSYPGYNLVWSDEFSVPLSSNPDWVFETGNNNGWGNNELEVYSNSPRNVFTSAGKLIIEARREANNGFGYSSARMITKGKKSFQYGRIDIRAKMPVGQGIWPALWMLGSNIDAVSWPACGEIDILELLGHEPNKIYGTLHWGANTAGHLSKSGSYTAPSGSYDQQFHVYSLIWQQGDVTILVDDVPYTHVTAADISGNNPFNSPFFFIFNVAVGGNWPGAPNSSTVFPQRMVVDYVRVFQ